MKDLLFYQELSLLAVKDLELFGLVMNKMIIFQQLFIPFLKGDNAGNWDHLAVAQPMLLSLGVAGITFSGKIVFIKKSCFMTLMCRCWCWWFFWKCWLWIIDSLVSSCCFPSILQVKTNTKKLNSEIYFCRGHAHLDSKRREPWLLGEPYLSHIRNAIRMRYSFLPYIYTLFHENTLTGMPGNLKDKEFWNNFSFSSDETTLGWLSRWYIYFWRTKWIPSWKRSSCKTSSISKPKDDGYLFTR